jgi:hypothetical protein
MFELLCALALQDEATELLKAVREKAQNAKSLRVAVRFAYAEAPPLRPAFDVEVRAKGESRWLYAMTPATNADGLSETLRAACDGTVVTARGLGEARREARKPEAYTRQLREWCATSCMPIFMSAAYHTVNQGDDNHPELSEARIVGREKVGDVDAQVVTYMLSYPTRTQTLVRAWIDPARKQPLKRFARNGQGGGFEETITAYEIDPETPDSLFATPEPTAADEARDRMRKIALRRLGEIRRGLLKFAAAEGRYPTAAEGLEALTKEPAAAKNWRGPYLDDPGDLRDPWGNAFTFRFPGLRDPSQVDVISPPFEGKDTLPLAKLKELLEPVVRFDEVVAAMKSIAEAQKSFHENDIDGNGSADFWVGDVSGLFRLVKGGFPIRLISKDVATADAAPLRAKPLDEPWPEKPTPYRGYFFAALSKGPGGKAYHGGSFRNPEAFGVVAWPADYPKSGRHTLILNTGGSPLARDVGGKRLDAWPGEGEDVKWSAPRSD